MPLSFAEEKKYESGTFSGACRRRAPRAGSQSDGGVGEVSGATRLWGTWRIGHGSSAVAVGMLRDIEKKTRCERRR